MKTQFETQVCSRCHGSGSFSWCQQYGTKCFKCHGSGHTLTKRGDAARAYLERICTIPASQVKVGDKIAATGITNGGKVFSFIGAVSAIATRQVRQTTTKALRLARDGSANPAECMDIGYKSEILENGQWVWSSSGSTVDYKDKNAGTFTEEFTEYTFTVTSKYGETTVTGKTVRIYPADYDAKIKEALEYQATLTKTGAIRKMKGN